MGHAEPVRDIQAPLQGAGQAQEREMLDLPERDDVGVAQAGLVLPDTVPKRHEVVPEARALLRPLLSENQRKSAWWSPSF